MEQQTSEYCLRTVLAGFITAATSKLEGLLSLSTDREIDLHRYLKHGVDPEFDARLLTIASLAKNTTRMALQEILNWREHCQIDESYTVLLPVTSAAKTPATMQEISLISANILFCRLLIEILKLLQQIPEDLGLKIEELSFNQLMSHNRGLNNQTNTTYFASLLGELSFLRFSSISDKLLELLSTKSETLIFAIRFMKLKLYPEDALEETGEFLESLGKVFVQITEVNIRIAFMDSMYELLYPICDVVEAEVNLPSWANFVELVYPKISKRASRPRYQNSLGLLTCLLSISRSEFFEKHWVNFLELCQARLKTSMKQEALLRLTQVLHLYLYKNEKNISNAQKRLGVVFKNLFPLTRRFFSPVEKGLDLLVYIVVMVGVRFGQWTVNNMLLPLLSCDGQPDQWAHERLTMAVMALGHLCDAWTEGGICLFPRLPLPNLRKTNKLKRDDLLRALGPALAKVFDGLYQFLGKFLVDDDKTKMVGIVIHASIPKDRLHLVDVFRLLVLNSPRIMPSYDPDKLIEILSSCLIHVDPNISRAAYTALHLICEKDQNLCSFVLLNLERKVMATNDKQFDILCRFRVKTEESETERMGTLEMFFDFFQKSNKQVSLDPIALYLCCSPYTHVHKIVFQMNGTFKKILEHCNFGKFHEVILYAVEFLSKDCVKKAVVCAYERANYLAPSLGSLEQGILWSTVQKAPSDEVLQHWKRCSMLVIYGLKHLSARDVFLRYLGFLTSDFASVRESTLEILSRVPFSYQSILMEELITLISSVSEDLKLGKKWFSQKKPGKLDRLRVELPNLLSLMHTFPVSCLSYITALLKSYKQMFIEQKNNLDLEPVKVSFCKFCHHYYTCDVDHKNVELRVSLFRLMNEWDDEHASRAMSAMLRTSLADFFDANEAFKWIQQIFDKSWYHVSELAIRNLILFNMDKLDKVFVFCYEEYSLKSEYFFRALCSVVFETQECDFATSLLILALLNLEKVNCAALVLEALQNIRFLNLELSWDLKVWNLCPIKILKRLLHWHPECTYILINEVFLRLSHCHESHFPMLFRFLSCLLENVKLSGHDFKLTSDSKFVLNDLIYFTLVHFSIDSWNSLLRNVNLRHAISYFVLLCTENQCVVLVEHFRRCLCSNAESCFLHLLSYLTPENFILTNEQDDDYFLHGFFFADLKQLIETYEKHQNWTIGTVSTLLMIGIIPYLSPSTIHSYFALILVILLSQADYPDTYVCEQVKQCLFLLFDQELNLCEIKKTVPKSIIKLWNKTSFTWACSKTIQQIALKCLEMFRLTLDEANEDKLMDLIQLFKENKALNQVFALSCLKCILSILEFKPLFSQKSLFECLVAVISSKEMDYVLDILLFAFNIIEIQTLKNVEQSIGQPIPNLLMTFFLHSGNKKCCLLLTKLLYIMPQNQCLPNIAILVLFSNLPFLVERKNQEWAPEWWPQETCSVLVAALPETLTSLKKFLLNWEKFSSKTSDDFLMHLSQHLKLLFLQQPLIYFGLCFSFLTIPDRIYVSVFLRFLKFLFNHSFEYTPVVTSGPLDLLKLCRDVEFAPLARQVLDLLFTAMPISLVTEKPDKSTEKIEASPIILDSETEEKDHVEYAREKITTFDEPNLIDASPAVSRELLKMESETESEEEKWFK